MTSDSKDLQTTKADVVMQEEMPSPSPSDSDPRALFEEIYKRIEAMEACRQDFHPKQLTDLEFLMREQLLPALEKKLMKAIPPRLLPLSSPIKLNVFIYNKNYQLKLVGETNASWHFISITVNVNERLDMKTILAKASDATGIPVHHLAAMDSTQSQINQCAHGLRDSVYFSIDVPAGLWLWNEFYMLILDGKEKTPFEQQCQVYNTETCRAVLDKLEYGKQMTLEVGNRVLNDDDVLYDVLRQWPDQIVPNTAVPVWKQKTSSASARCVV